MRYLLMNLFVLLPITLYAQDLEIGGFSKSGLDGWYEKNFLGRTSYSLVILDRKQMLHASAKQSASGYCKDQKIDLTVTPYVAWSWRLDSGPPHLDEKTKSGDDHPLRLYFVHKQGWFNALAIQYAWSLSEPKGSLWPSPYTSHMMQIATDSGEEEAGKLIYHQRNLREDFARAFQKDITHIDTVCIMTDADNSHSSAEAWYGDILITDRAQIPR